MIKIPNNIRLFILKCFFIFIAWQSLYFFFFLPTRIFDRPISLFTGKSTVFFVKKIIKDKEITCKEIVEKVKNRESKYFEYEKTNIYINDSKILGISDSCNGLSLYILFIGFIIAFPAKLYHKIEFGFLGLLLIVGLNIMRCVALLLLQYKFPLFFSFAHHYIFNILMYSVVFFLWIKFTKFYEKKSVMMPKKFWSGLILIILIYSAYYIFFLDSKNWELISRAWGHIIKFGTLLLVYLIGVLHLKFSNVSWMKTIWHAIHLCGIIFLLVVGFFDSYINSISLHFKHFLITVHEFLIAPTLYVIMGILYEYLPNNIREPKSH